MKVCIRLVKIKNKYRFSEIEQHNYRELITPNADSEKFDLNKEFIAQTEKWSSILEKRINQGLDKGLYSRKIRRDAILGFEVVASIPNGAKGKINIDEWAETTVEWLKQKFNIAGDEDNVVSAVLHMDEKGPHIHCVFLPFDNNGKLNGTYFVSGRQKYVELQDEYAEAVKKFGLERGLKNSRAKHEDIQKFYAKLNYALDQELPIPEKDESIEDYYERANTIFKGVQLQRFQEQKKAERDVAEANTNSYNEARELQRRARELEELREKTENEIKEKKKAAQEEIEKKKLEADIEINKQTKGLKRIYEEIYGEGIAAGNMDFKDILEDMKAFNVFKKALAVYPDDKIRTRTVERITKIYKWYIEEEKARKMLLEDYLAYDKYNEDLENR